MTRRAEGDAHGLLNLVASDLLFGLGAVILVAVAALSLNVREVVARAIAERAASEEDSRQAAATLAAGLAGPILLADAQGLHRFAAGSRATIPLDDLWAAPELDLWLRETVLLVIAPPGQDAAFLTFSRAAALQLAPLPTLRLTQECRALQATGDGVLCQP